MKESTLSMAGPARKVEPEGTKSEFAFVDRIISFEHATGQWRIAGLVKSQQTGVMTELEKELGSSFGITGQEWSSWSSGIIDYFTNPPPSKTVSLPPFEPVTFDSLTSDLPLTEYCQAVESAKATISAGDAYELCLTTQFRTTLSTALATDPFPLYKKLRISNPAPYSAYFRLPHSKLSILSSSPERFMRISKEGEVEMKPIKGTIRRALADPIEDERRKKVLEADEKERAENLMIVDLCRNDLLGFCQVETVKVPRLMIVESYETVHQ